MPRLALLRYDEALRRLLFMNSRPRMLYKRLGYFAFAILILSLPVYYFVSMSYRHVSQSDSWVSLDAAQNQVPGVFDKFPDSVKEIRFANCVVGLKGWCLVYAVRAPSLDLHALATSELSSYSGPITKIPISAFPFDEEDVSNLEKGYSVNVDWLLIGSNSTGVIYRTSDRIGLTIFVDDASETLYFVCTD